MVDVNLSFSLLLSLSYIYIISSNCLSVKHFFYFLSDRQVRTSFSFISLLITLRALSLLIFTLRHFTCPTVFTRVKACFKGLITSSCEELLPTFLLGAGQYPEGLVGFPSLILCTYYIIICLFCQALFLTFLKFPS